VLALGFPGCVQSASVDRRQVGSNAVISSYHDMVVWRAQSSNPAASPHTLGSGFVRGHPIFTSMILPHNIVYHPTNHPKENWYVSTAALCSILSMP